MLIFFSFLHENIRCELSLESPHQVLITSCFHSEIRKICIYLHDIALDKMIAVIII